MVLSSGTSPAGCLDILSQVGEDPCYVAGHSRLGPLTIVASCISEFLSSTNVAG